MREKRGGGRSGRRVVSPLHFLRSRVCDKSDDPVGFCNRSIGSGSVHGISRGPSIESSGTGSGEIERDLGLTTVGERERWIGEWADVEGIWGGSPLEGEYPTINTGRAGERGGRTSDSPVALVDFIKTIVPILFDLDIDSRVDCRYLSRQLEYVGIRNILKAISESIKIY